MDEKGHGTHVAGTIASPINGFGMAGVAPNVTLVNVRAGQDSGYFFLWETVNALKYAGDIGADVANMSFYTDPWQFNCPNNPRRPPEAQAEQQTIVQATIDAAVLRARPRRDARRRAGNSRPDLDNPKPDVTSPDFPPAGSTSARSTNLSTSRPRVTTC